MHSAKRGVTAAERNLHTTVHDSAIREALSPVSIEYENERAIAEWLRQLNAKEQSSEGRRRAAVALAKNGSERAMKALKETLLSGTPEIQEIVVEALGQCAHSETPAILASLLNNERESVVLSAIRSISRQKSPMAVTSLSEVLNDEQRSVDVRAEAGLGLGAVAGPQALAELATAVLQIQDEAVASQVIRGVAGRSIDETRAFLEAFLDAPQMSSELKAEALEGLSQAQGDATSFLLKYVESDDPELRSAAAWALSALETQGNAGADIIALLKKETDPVVRKRLYQALANQESFDLNAAWMQTANEAEPMVRTAGLDLLARAVQQNPSAEMIAFFDQHVLPELKTTTLNARTREVQLAAIMALRRAQTANAITVLREIATQASDAGIAAATGFTLSAHPRPDSTRQR